ncbi:3424_t:CDS:2 [Dentiscutata erythropus]|uniref:3424_t:CDS:1 n=1 Tax=Dentiscutata erythropus TaxID=1348616 RepID=A0A9N9BVB9_9GLOM|nr:3424_t:CDS:2 [Dentiscutata erythropus]
MCYAKPGQVTCLAPGCTRPIYEKNGVRHPYCGLTCARSCDDKFTYQNLTNGIAEYKKFLETPFDNEVQCKIAECKQSIYVDPNGRHHSYCSRSCARKEKTMENSTAVRLIDIDDGIMN